LGLISVKRGLAASKMEGIEQWKTEAQQWLQQGIEYAHQLPPTQLYAAVAVLLFTTLLLLTSNSLLLFAYVCFISNCVA
jgi:hypothetical protein